MATHTSATVRDQASDASRTPHVNPTRTATTQAHNDGPSEQKVQTLAEIIWGAGDESAGALFVLMGTLQQSNQPEVLANTVKHLAFTRCGELNLFGMVDDQIAERELFVRSKLVC